jgi:hypothetical protein
VGAGGGEGAGGGGGAGESGGGGEGEGEGAVAGPPAVADFLRAEAGLGGRKLEAALGVCIGLGRIVALHHRSST